MELPNDDALRWIVTAYGRFHARHGGSIGTPDLVLPNAEFFPDEFHRDGPSVARLLTRMIHYAPIRDDLGIQLAFVEPDAARAGGCGSLACESEAPGAGRALNVQELDVGYRILVEAADVPYAEALTGSLSRAVGALVLHEADDPVDAPTSEIAAVACGFGVLLSNGAAVWAKACSGLRLARTTVLSVEEVAVALALFLAAHGARSSEARAHLGATQRAALDVATDWVESNPLLAETLRDRPGVLEAGTFDIEPIRGPIGRWLHKRKLEKELRPAQVTRSAMTEERRRRLEEARALVDEAAREISQADPEMGRFKAEKT
jgi:hypothetical protein